MDSSSTNLRAGRRPSSDGETLGASGQISLSDQGVGLKTCWEDRKGIGMLRDVTVGDRRAIKGRDFGCILWGFYSRCSQFLDK